jgi:hypothetical protein
MNLHASSMSICLFFKPIFHNLIRTIALALRRYNDEDFLAQPELGRTYALSDILKAGSTAIFGRVQEWSGQSIGFRRLGTVQILGTKQCVSVIIVIILCVKDLFILI